MNTSSSPPVASCCGYSKLLLVLLVGAHIAPLAAREDEPTSYFAHNSLHELFDNRLTFDQYLAYSMRAIQQIAGYDVDLHRYDDRHRLADSFARNLSSGERSSFQLRQRMHPSELRLLADQSEPTLLENERNQAACGRHLTRLLELTHQLLRDFDSFSGSRRLSLIDFLDSFGSPESRLLQGNTMWLGSHQQCASAKLLHLGADGEEPAGEIGVRYCIANFRSPNWAAGAAKSDRPEEEEEATTTTSDRLGAHSIKLGVCLPNSCNSISYHRHSKLIERLVRLAKLRQTPFDRYDLTHLYCLPDEHSPLRQLSLSARLFIGSLAVWLALVGYLSLKYEYLRVRALQAGERLELDAECSKLMQTFAFRLSWRRLFEGAGGGRQCAQSSARQNANGPSRQLAANGGTFEVADRSGCKANMSEAMRRTCSSGDNLAKMVTLRPADLADSLKSAVVILSSQSKGGQASRLGPKVSVDLSVIDGIKVISMIWLISAHTMLFFIRTIANGRDFWSILREAKFLTVMAGIFPVDSFFTITGILTAFLKFNKNHGASMGNCSYWIEAFVHRYLRFMPMYLIVFWYTRDVSEYIGLGPLWDYATADTSLRSVCKRESVSVPLLFQANFKPIDQHCVKPAWYLANDYQYLLLTPLFMLTIMRSRALGYLLIGFSVAVSLVAQFLTVYYSDQLDDFGALINFKPMFGAYILKNLWKLYVLPYNRIAPYLIGLLTGHLMHELNQAAMKRREKHPQLELTQSHQITRASQVIDKQQQQTPYHSQESLESCNFSSHRQSSSSILQQASEIRSNNAHASLFEASTNYLCVKVWTPIVFLISIIYLPLLTKLVPDQEGEVAKIGSASIIALMRFIWSLAIARLIYVCATRHLHLDTQCMVGGGNNTREHNNTSNPDNNPDDAHLEELGELSPKRGDSFVVRFLSASIWRPWSKIGLSALLIQWEIISYLAQTQTSAPDMTITFLLAIVLLCIVATYSLALLIFLTIEYPLSQVEQLYLHPLLFSKR